MSSAEAFKSFRCEAHVFCWKVRKTFGDNKPSWTCVGYFSLSRGQKSEKCIERAESLTETLATQANFSLHVKRTLVE